MADYIYMMESRLTPEQKRGVMLVQDAARAHGMNVYLAGGTVRDIISGANLRDLDFAVQGNALKIQRDLEKAGAIIEGVDEHLRTMYVLMPGNLRGEISSTRAETYDKPGKPPETTPATINEDLRRRDFTINAMALSLNPGSRGLLLDPFNGVADIESKLIRILHNYAFLEEPTRMIRAIRFAARLEWSLEERTRARYDSAVENDYMDHVNRKLLGHEVEQVAHENEPLKVMKALEKEGWLKVLHPHWAVAKVDTSGLHTLVKLRQQMQDLGYTLDAGPAIMHFITRKMKSGDVAALQSAIHRKPFVQAWKHLDDEALHFAHELMGKKAATNSQAWKFLSESRPETILYTGATSRLSAAVKRIHDFLGKWRQMRTKLPYAEMTELRITPELPEYSKLSEEMFLLLLDGKLKSRTEIIKFLSPYSPPVPEPPPQAARRGRGAKKSEGAKATTSTAGLEPKAKRSKKGAAPAVPVTVPTGAVPPAKKAAEKPAPAKAKARPAKKLEHKGAKKPVKKPAPKPKKKTAVKKKKTAKGKIKKKK